MRRHLKTVILGGLLLILAVPATAEFYEYVDNKGITHFTDNRSTIPPRYQSQIEQYAEIAPPHTGTKKAVAPKPGAAPSVDVHSNINDELAAKPAEISKLAEKQKILLDKKQALNRKFEMLMAEKQALEKRRETITDKREMVRHNLQVREINQKIRKFKISEKQFLNEINNFNTAVNVWHLP